MSDPYLGEIRMFAFDYPLPGWAACDGQLKRVDMNAALFSLLGFTYGGDGYSRFALPNLNGKTVIHASASHAVGEEGGMDSLPLWPAMTAMHTHNLMVSTLTGNAAIPTGNVPASPVNPLYGAATALVPLKDGSVTYAGSGEAHENRQPYLVLNFMIAIAGIFPSS